MPQTLTSRDESSGVNVLDDGTKIFFKEGRGKPTIIVTKDKREVIWPEDRKHHPLYEQMMAVYDDGRLMTKEEEKEANQQWKQCTT